LCVFAAFLLLAIKMNNYFTMLLDYYKLDLCDVTLSVYPHRASLKDMPGQGRRNWGGQEGQPPPLPFTRRGKGAKVPFHFKGLPWRNSELSEMLVQFFYEFASENARNAVIELQEQHNRLAENPYTPLSSNK
jgi:hypothetical protein